VFAWTGYEYANYWNWTTQYGGPPWDYTWYIQNTDGGTFLYNRETQGGLHQINTAANVRRLGIQNHEPTPSNWYGCWAVH
jgi:hypothetical protein